MKPILQINHKQRSSRRDNRVRRNRQGFPLTDYNYHPTAESQVNSSARWPATKSPAFHELSSEFLGGEASRDYLAELFLHCDHWACRLADRVHAHCSDTPDQELLMARISQAG